jgi:hypothetical protein
MEIDFGGDEEFDTLPYHPDDGGMTEIQKGRFRAEDSSHAFPNAHHLQVRHSRPAGYAFSCDTCLKLGI